eukprot:TRINITY_DN22495_c0_g1_i1.p1 TRINITY_DN22495_c0_g1~~TRINITY_DN22495_c0_g1_i1.p1  ORF type:complete len:231 (+),score=25.56 TRINITY_DN22495_c0_g1_i1:47-694(+)
MAVPHLLKPFETALLSGRFGPLPKSVPASSSAASSPELAVFAEFGPTSLVGGGNSGVLHASVLQWLSVSHTDVPRRPQFVAQVLNDLLSHSTFVVSHTTPTLADFALWAAFTSCVDPFTFAPREASAADLSQSPAAAGGHAAASADASAPGAQAPPLKSVQQASTMTAFARWLDTVAAATDASPQRDVSMQWSQAVPTPEPDTRTLADVQAKRKK